LRTLLLRRNWTSAHQLALEVYRQSAQLPAEERFGLTAHLRKTAISIPSNIAEGCGRHGDRELIRFLSIASGSAAELEYQLLLAHDLAYLPAQAHRQIDALVREVKRMLYRFIQSLADA
jgi:four helix bundle protein